MRTSLFAALLATSAITVGLVEAAYAQRAEAIGHPLPAGDLPVGTITVRVIAGTMSSAVTETAVTLTVNGTPREARTDATGRATFGGLPAGAKVKAVVLDADQKEVASDEFPVPASGGVKVMLSTKPFAGGAGAMPAMQGGGGMPEARVISGEPRPDGTNQPGSYSVRLTYNNLKMGKAGPDDDAPPVGEPVHLASYRWDGTIAVKTAPTDAKGNATFDNLDQSGGTTYFAFGALRRGDKLDRMIAKPMTLDNQNGVRVVLSALKRDATDAGVDDYDQFTAMRNTTPAGKARIMLAGAAQAGQTVELIDIATGKAITSSPVIPGPPDPANVEAGGEPVPTKEAPGTIEISLVGGAGQKQDPMQGVVIELIDGATDDTITGAGVTDAQGKLKLTVPATLTSGVKVAFHFGLPPMTELDPDKLKDLGGTTITSQPIDLSKNGVLLAVEAHWPQSSGFEATLDMPPGKLMYAQVSADAKTGNEKFRSRPFESFADAGVLEKINVWKRTPEIFDAVAFVDDQQFVVQGQYAVQNWGWEPVRAGADGLVIPFPSNMRHPVVAAKDQTIAAVAPGQGYRILRPIPPGGVAFGFGFDVSIDGGSSTVAFPSKFGTMGARFRVRQNPGQVVTMPPGQKGTPTATSDWYVIQNVSINPGQEFSVTVSGLPSAPSWKIWMPRILGVLVLLILLGGIGYAIVHTPAEGVPADAKRRETLLEELVALEKRGNLNAKERKEREKLIDELERIWGN
ncbi:hypothetical protein BH11MYX2_BH11MYX2_11790 [soil metagenome]